MLTKKDQLKKNGRLKPQPYKSKEYLEWIHTKPCIVCGVLPVHAHHVDRGIGARRDDSVVPLCYSHHIGDRWSAHGSDAILFNSVFPKEYLLDIAKKLHSEYLSEK